MTTTPTAPSSPITATHEEVTRGVRRSAVVAGVGLLTMAVLAFASVAAISALVADDDAARTATDLLASAGTFRLSVAALIVVAGLDIVVAWALRAFFAPVNAGLSTLAAWFRLSYAAVFAVAIGQLVAVLPLLHGSPALSAISIDQRSAAAMLQIQSYLDIWNVGLALFGLHLLLIGYLAFVSGYVPRVLGVLLAIAGAGYLVDSFGALIVEDYSVNVVAFTFIGEALLMLWLLVRGRRVSLKG